MENTNDETIDFLNEDISPDGPPYLELQNIEVATWELRNELMAQLEAAVERGDLKKDSVSSAREMVFGVQGDLQARIMEILKLEGSQEFAMRWIIEEVCVNSGATHGNEGDPTKVFEAMYGLDTSTESVLIYVGDQGEGFNPHAVPDPTAALSRLEKSSGRGLHTMDQLQLPKFEGSRGIYLPIHEGSELCREFVVSIPVSSTIR